MIDRLIITGGAGFIGSHLVEYFLDKRLAKQIIVFDKMTYAADVRNILNYLSTGAVELYVGDVADMSNCEEVCARGGTIIHAAAESHVDNSFNNSTIFTRSNALGTHVLLEAARKFRIDKIIHISTDEVYGENQDGAHDEMSPINPTNPYAASKASAEMIAKSYIHAFSMPITIIRANNIYGIRQFPEKLIPKTIMRLLSGKKALIQGNGNNQRSFLAASDLAQGVELLLNSKYNHGVYNIGSFDEFTVNQVIGMICNILNLNPELNIELIEDRPFNDSRYLIDYQKISKLGWSQKQAFVNDLPALVSWYKENFNNYNHLAFE